MRRRQALTLVVQGGLFVGLAGCSQLQSSNDGSGNGNGDSDGNLSLGESATHGAVTVTVVDYLTATRLQVPVQGEDVTTTPSSPTEKFLFTKIRAEHTGEGEEQKIPNRSPMAHGHFEVTLQDAELDRFLGTGDPRYFIIDGEQYNGYEETVDSETGDEPVYNISLSGWIVNRFRGEIEPSDAEISIQWGGETATWAYDSEQ